MHSSVLTLLLKDRRDGSWQASRRSGFCKRAVATEKALFLVATTEQNLSAQEGW